MPRFLNKSFVKELAKKQKKRIEITAINKISKIIEKKTEDIIKNASRNAEFFSRRTIKKEDIKEDE